MMINYREFNLNLRVADGLTYATEGYDDKIIVFRSGNRNAEERCARARRSIPPLFPTRFRKERSHCRRPSRGYCSQAQGRSFDRVSLDRKLSIFYGYRVDCSTREDACAVLVPEKLPNESVVSVNDDCGAGHSRAALLRKTKEQQGIVFDGKVVELLKLLHGEGSPPRYQAVHTLTRPYEIRRLFLDLSGP